jgi:hypothetical protein
MYITLASFYMICIRMYIYINVSKFACHHQGDETCIILYKIYSCDIYGCNINCVFVGCNKNTNRNARYMHQNKLNQINFRSTVMIVCATKLNVRKIRIFSYFFIFQNTNDVD